MKKIICLSIILGALFFSCQTDNETLKAENQTLSIENVTLDSTTRSKNSKPSNPGSTRFGDTPIVDENGDFICSNYSFATGTVGGLNEYYLTVYYDSYLVPASDVACVRYEFFQRYPYLKMAVNQPGNPFVDIWVDRDPCIFPDSNGFYNICTPNGSNPTSAAKKGTEDDPRTNS